MHAAAIGSPSEPARPTLEPDPDDPIAWARRQLSWERRLDVLHEAAKRRDAGHLRSCSIPAPDK
jgi:hypothetical protein